MTKFVFWNGVRSYVTWTNNNPEEVVALGINAPKDFIERHLYGKFSKFGVILMGVIDVVLFGPWGLLVWGVQMAWIPVTAAGVINGLGHYVGYRNTDTNDESRNIVPWGILIGGEELHNNHHAHPAWAKLSLNRFEFDIGWTYIRLLEMCGMAKVRQMVIATPLCTKGDE
jgi:stearoyl-CoA desaturase (delta-9 desaturase)